MYGRERRLERLEQQARVDETVELLIRTGVGRSDDDDGVVLLRLGGGAAKLAGQERQP